MDLLITHEFSLAMHAVAYPLPEDMFVYDTHVWDLLNDHFFTANLRKAIGNTYG